MLTLAVAQQLAIYWYRYLLYWLKWSLHPDSDPLLMSSEKGPEKSRHL